MVEGQDASTLLLRWEWGSTEPHSRRKAITMISPLKSQILLILSAHRGPERRISRANLKGELNERLASVTDREMRAAIEDLRREHAQGAWICADMRGGYFMARNAQEIEGNLASDERRAQRLMERVTLQRLSIALQNRPQLDLLDDAE